MLEKPDLPDETITRWIRDQYGLQVAAVAFLPLGADVHTAVYRIMAGDGTLYFLKLRWGAFDEICVAIPGFLHAQGIREIISPIPASTGQLWTRVDDITLILFLFVESRNAYQVDLSDAHWVELGAALKSIHTEGPPAEWAGRIPREAYSAHWRELVRIFQRRAEEAAFVDPVAARLAAFMQSERDVIRDLVERAERLAGYLQARSPENILCHADLHAGNVLIDREGALYIVDWDNPILAPKERDLMFIGGGLFGNWRSPKDEETPFYRGYGQTEIDPIALAYYRYERIVEDIAAFCDQLFLTDEGGADREQSLEYFVSSFLPGHVIDIAYRSDKVILTHAQL